MPELYLDIKRRIRLLPDQILFQLYCYFMAHSHCKSFERQTSSGTKQTVCSDPRVGRCQFLQLLLLPLEDRPCHIQINTDFTWKCSQLLLQGGGGWKSIVITPEQIKYTLNLDIFKSETGTSFNYDNQVQAFIIISLTIIVIIVLFIILICEKVVN